MVVTFLVENDKCNPFTAPACKISGLKDARTHLKNRIFSGPLTSPFSAVHFDGNPLQSPCGKEKKKAETFKFSPFVVTSWQGRGYGISQDATTSED